MKRLLLDLDHGSASAVEGARGGRARGGRTGAALVLELGQVDRVRLLADLLPLSRSRSGSEGRLLRAHRFRLIGGLLLVLLVLLLVYDVYFGDGHWAIPPTRVIDILF